MLKGLETAIYHVDDVKAAGAWYAKVLGLTPNHDTEHYVGFTVGGDELGLHPVGEGPGRPGIDGQTAYWSVDDVDAAVAHFVEHGAKAQGVQDVGGGILVATVVDPFGNAFGLIQNPHSPNR